MFFKTFASLAALALVATAAQASPPPAIAAHAKYVAMGSSFAAGPGVGTPADTPANRCARSSDNYAHQLARKLDLTLVDVSCSGATTAAISAPWNELSAQIDAVTPDTALVTLTIGGNDVGYIGNLTNASCRKTQASHPEAHCGDIQPPSEATFQKAEEAMRLLAIAIHRKAPQARIIFVDYPTILPDGPLCAATPLGSNDEQLVRMTAVRVEAMNERIALLTDAENMTASILSQGHDACSAQPWIAGYLGPDGARVPVPYHPNLAGMTAVADALAKKVSIQPK